MSAGAPPVPGVNVKDRDLRDGLNVSLSSREFRPGDHSLIRVAAPL